MQFTYDEHGKPPLAHGRLSLAFNLSHSGRLVLLALTSAAPVGIDVERVKASTDLAAIAHRFFSPAERVELARISRDGYAEAFYRCWARKEAHLKAIGEGLMAPLDSFDVTVLDDSAPCLRRAAGADADPSSLDAAPSLAGC